MNVPQLGDGNHEGYEILEANLIPLRNLSDTIYQAVRGLQLTSDKDINRYWDLSRIAAFRVLRILQESQFTPERINSSVRSLQQSISNVAQVFNSIQNKSEAMNLLLDFLVYFTESLTQNNFDSMLSSFDYMSVNAKTDTQGLVAVLSFLKRDIVKLPAVDRADYIIPFCRLDPSDREGSYDIIMP